MSKYLLLAVASLLSLPSLASAQPIPIPQRPDGFQLGGPASAPVVLEAFFDLMCPDSKAAWPTIQQVVAHYNDSVHFRLHLFPLPYHYNSFIANQGAHIISNNPNSSAEAVFDYTSLIFANQDSFGNAVTANQPVSQTIEAMGEVVAKAGLVDSVETFVNGIADPNLNWAQRVSWKYGCSRSVTGTPAFLINGASIGASASYALSDWTSVIDPILAPLAPTFRMIEQFVPVTSGPVCKPGQPICNFLPGQHECCLPGEACIPNVGCRC